MALDEHTVETFHDSLDRCQATPTFFANFYDRFIRAHPEVAAKFARTDMRKQQWVLQASLHMIMLASQGNGASQVYLARVAERHSRRHLDIPPEMYDLWLQCLVETVAEIDPRFNEDVRLAWRRVMASGISYMKSGYEE